MSELRELYQELILEHNKSPRNFKVLPDANCKAEGYNPLCGDRITLFMKVDQGVIQDVGFQGAGCAISKASTSMMTTCVKGKTLDEADAIFKSFHQMVAQGTCSEEDRQRLGKLTVFSGVTEFPVRVKCASLAWHTLHSGLKGEAKTVSTE